MADFTNADLLPLMRTLKEATDELYALYERDRPDFEHRATFERIADPLRSAVLAVAEWSDRIAEGAV